MNTYTCTPEKWLENAKIPMRVMEKEAEMYDEMSRLMADSIIENNKKGEKTVIICPVGPIMQYPPFAEIINKERN